MPLTSALGSEKAVGRSRTESEIAAGKLVSAIQKEWGQYLGEQGAEVAESIMQFLGGIRVAQHPSVNRAIENREATLR